MPSLPGVDGMLMRDLNPGREGKVWRWLTI